MFNTAYKTPVHIVQVILTIVVLALAGYRMMNRDPNVPQSTSDRMALGMGAKGLIIIAYQLLTEHVAKFQRWASLKANLILNCIETVLWAAVGGMGMQRLTQFCGEGTTCALGWLLSVLAFVLSLLAFYVSVLSYKEFKAARRGDYKSQSVPMYGA